MAVDWLACAHQAIQNWSITPRSIQFVNHSENVTFQVIDEHEKKFVLRIHRPEYHNLQELQSEQAWTEALLTAGLDVPVPVRTLDGSRFAQVQVGDHTRNVGILKWVDGSSLRDLSHTSNDVGRVDEIYYSVGKLLAVLHEQASAWLPPSWFVRHAFDADGLMGDQPFWGRFWDASSLNAEQRQHLSQVRIRLHRLLSKLPKDASSYSLIHADLHTGNIIKHGNNLHIIDFDDAGFGWHAYDFAVVLSDTPAVESDYRGNAQEALFRGYEELRPILPWVKSLVPLFRIIRSLASIGWTEARPELNRPSGVGQHLYELAAASLDEVIKHSETTIARIVDENKTRHNAQSLKHNSLH